MLPPMVFPKKGFNDKMNQADRKQKLLKCFKSVDDNIKTIVKPIINDMTFLETELCRLRELPQIRVHPKNPEKQEQTAAAKLYKDFISRYTDIVYKLVSILRREEAEDESPLRMYLKNIQNDKEN